MAYKTFAAIDVGSTDVTMKIYEITAKKGYRLLDYVSNIIELGSGTYANGYISQKTVHDALEADYYIKIRYDEIRRLDKLIAHKKDELSIKNRKDLRLIDVGLSTRVFGILHRAGLRHLGDICVLTEKEVKSLPGVGGKALDEIKEMMSMHRVTFAKEEE